MRKFCSCCVYQLLCYPSTSNMMILTSVGDDDDHHPPFCRISHQHPQYICSGTTDMPDVTLVPWADDDHHHHDDFSPPSLSKHNFLYPSFSLLNAANNKKSSDGLKNKYYSFLSFIFLLSFLLSWKMWIIPVLIRAYRLTVICNIHYNQPHDVFSGTFSFSCFKKRTSEMIVIMTKMC